MKRKISLLLLVVLLFGSVPAMAEEVTLETRLDALGKIISAIFPETPADMTLLEPYTDLGDVVEWRLSILAYGLEFGIIVGYGDGTLHPNEPITRAEYATMLYRASSYLEEYPKLGTCAIQYTDAADWNRDALTYCVEHGFMLGYGNNVFGCNDFITAAHSATVYRRLLEGLTTIEKFQFQSYFGTSPIKIDAILATANDPKYTIDTSQFLFQSGTETPWEPSEANRRGMVLKYQKFVELAHGFDYTTCNTEEQIQARYEEIYDLWHFPIEGAEKEDLQKLADNHVRCESFFVLSPQNVEQTSGGWTMFFVEAKGCKYFIYYEADEGALPEGVELNKWYRQDIDFRYYSFTTAYYFYNRSIYGAIEPVPAELLN